MKTINAHYWNLYKDSPEGKSAVLDFQKLLSDQCEPGYVTQIVRKYDPEFFLNSDNDYGFPEYYQDIDNLISNLSISTPETIEDCEKIYRKVIDKVASFFPKSKGCQPYRETVGFIIPISICLYRLKPDFFLPYFFVLKYESFRWIADEYGITIEDIPGRTSYEKRCLYYLEICKVASELFKKCGQNIHMTPAEKNAFLYGLCYQASLADLKNFDNPHPRVWFIGGWFKEGEPISGRMHWECNADTRKGDILLFYETSKSLDKSKRQKLTSVWRAASDGVVDPFFYYYETAYIDNRIDVPYVDFSTLYNHPIIGEIGIVKKLFNGVAGYEVKPSEYEIIKNLMEVVDSSYDFSLLPALEISSEFIMPDILVEKDVEEKLIIRLLEKMGLGGKEDSDKKWDRQVELQLGRAKKEAHGYTDFSVFPFGEDKKYADILIETKHGKRELKNEGEVKVAFKQAESYAAHQYAGLLMIVDEHYLRLYYRGTDGVFQYTPDKDTKKFQWTVLTDNDEFNELRKEFNKYHIHRTH